MTVLGMDPGWTWLIGGVVLLIAEVIAPGFFLIFIGAAAIATGLFTVLFGLGLVPQLALFTLYALLAVGVGRRVYSRRRESSDPLLNDPNRRLVGKVVTVVAAVDAHHGRVRVADSEWSARGGPAAPGDRVRVTRIEGNCLIVEAERALTAS